MGSPVLPVIADIFMEDLEDQAFLGHTNQTPPRLWKKVRGWRYISHKNKKKQDKHSYLDLVNKRHERIASTIEPEVDGLLPYMAIRFRRIENGKLNR